MTLIKKSFFIFLLSLGVNFSVLNSGKAATSASTEFKATIVGGACDITAPLTIVINGGTVISSEEIASKANPAEVFELNLSGCQGYGLTPAITLEGNVSNISGTPLFLNNTSTTKGYGILLATVGNGNFKKNDNLAADMKITATDKPWSVTQTSILNGSLLMIASVSCGDCTGSDMQGGELKAAVAFKFVYN
ncbi:fimbrial-like protein [Morganella morganii]|uniref:fimbrial-like protein n=1 Tax=Morganella morganii TaxID=582 RepID=UPI001BD9FC9D|nr:fimbrial-like protein [Morganella morganii]ELT0453596.1 fimbrial-like protein [Morganella morganii]MBT0336862.1 fimbrial-like protein [Morganella morganii subsp. morganii]